MKNRVTFLKELFCILLFFSGPILLTYSQDSAQTEDKTEEEEEKDPFKSVSEMVKSSHKIDGLFPLYQDTITGKVLLELTEAHLGKEYIHFFHTENGSISSGWLKGSYGWETIFKIRRYFDRIEFVGQNTDFYFDPESPLSRAGNANINEPIIAVEKIVAASKSLDTMLIAADALFLSETFPQLTFAFPPGPNAPKNPFKKGKLSSTKTRYNSLKNYPENTDIIVDYVYENPSPTNYGLATTTDARYSSIQLQHSLVAMPDNDYMPRYDDPRVGYFLTQVTDQTSESPTPYRDMIHRWHLKKKNPEAALSEPVEPITFWMENTTPMELRPIIKEGVEKWNIAFEKAGFINAVLVKQQPDDAEWDAGDLRYNVLRWTAAPYMGSAWGPSFVNPRTGQILGADIMLDYVFVRGTSTTDKIYNSTSKSLEELLEEKQEVQVHPKHIHNHMCEANNNAIKKVEFGRQVSRAFNFSEAETQKMIREAIIELLLHEVGHTLGLSHNFRSSQIWNMDQVHDKSLTESEGLTGSVMDYNPLNLTLDRSKQGNYQSLVPGPYDKWAIEHSYTPALEDPTEEQTRIDKLLARSTEAQLTFGNDADAHRAPGIGMDPTINTWDMSSDAISYGLERIELCKQAMTHIMDKLTTDGDSYQELVSGYNTLLWNSYTPLNVIVRYIGGVKVDRAMKGQNNTTTTPFTPISKYEQKRAMKAIVDHGFSPSAFTVSGNLYPYLQYQRRGWDHWGQTEDPKILERIGAFQNRLLSHVMHPTVLNRMSNTRYYGNAYSVTEMLSDVTSGIFDADLKSAVNPARQNLQINYVQGLISGLNNGSHNNLTKSAMLYQINEIRDMVKSNKGRQLETKAHRAHVMHLINSALDTD